MGEGGGGGEGWGREGWRSDVEATQLISELYKPLCLDEDIRLHISL